MIRPILFILVWIISVKASNKPLLTLVGPLNFNNGIGRIAPGIADCLPYNVAINWRPTRNQPAEKLDLPTRVHDILIYDKTPGYFSILTDLLSDHSTIPSDKVPKESLIKIAYSMIESTQIPQNWKTILNDEFDAVIVPDEWLVEVYKNSGVAIPIFVLPPITYLEPFFKKIKKIKQEPFIFGNSSTSINRKNLIFLMKAFDSAFHENDNVKLVIHTKAGPCLKEILEFQKSLANKNISIEVTSFSWKKYQTMLSNFDCYVSFSKGEGFAVPPREALALGIPVILANNTAHQSICKTGYVKAVQSEILEPAYYHLFDSPCGHFFNTELSSAIDAVLDVYTHHEYYKQKAAESQNWLKQFTKAELKKKYMNILDPYKIRLGIENKVTESDFVTTDIKLYEKYQILKRDMNMNQIRS